MTPHSGEGVRCYYKSHISNLLTPQFLIWSLTCRCLGVCAMSMGVFMYKVTHTPLIWQDQAVAVCLYNKMGEEGV